MTCIMKKRRDVMILNVSGRTDIVAFYEKWFMKRYQEGFVDVRNPFYPDLIHRIYFNEVDAILFCTKNPLPILPDINKIHHPILFHITLTPYHKEIEPNVISKAKIIEGIKQLSKYISKENIIIRYDPIFINKKYTISYHKKAFDHLCSLLDGYTETIIVSFIDLYKNVKRNAHILNLEEFTESDYKEIGISFSESARKHGMTVQTCSEEHNLTEYGFRKGDCISHDKAYQLTKKSYKTWKARKSKHCHCVEMTDIGYYNSCNHMCRYCYANFDEAKVKENISRHDPNASLLIGHIKESDAIKERKKNNT